MAARANGVFCLEGAWERRLDDRTSVLPSLELLERIGHIRYIHRVVGTSDELYHYLAKWAQRGYHAYSVLYFAFHGVRGGIDVGRGVVPLSDLAEKLEGSASGRVIHFGACSVMSDRDAVAEFHRATGAKAVVGYRKEVDWVESAALDLLLLSSLTDSGRIDARINQVRKKAGGLADRLGFESFPSFDRS
ncbi:MAG: DUF6642 family protein [Acidimicrobiia bacterium]